VSVGDDSTVINAGLISAGRLGVALGSNGTLINRVGARIDGQVTNQGTGIATIVNAGSIVAGNYVDSIPSGIYLHTGAMITNKSGGVIDGAILIVGATSPVKIENQAGASITTTNEPAIKLLTAPAATIVNAGTVTGRTGVQMNDGRIANQAGGVIQGATVALACYGVVGITNAGAIVGAARGVWLANGGSVTNGATGLISGNYGVLVEAATGLVDNHGAINGGIVGVELSGGGQVTNLAGGTISGAQGVYALVGAATVTNAGTISGSTNAVHFDGAGANKLVLQTGSVLKGGVVGSTASGATNALVLHGAGKVFNRFQNFSSVQMQGPGTWTLDGFGTFGDGTVSAGTLQVGDASHTAARIVIDGAVVNKGVLAVGGGVLSVIGGVTGSGSAAISGGALKFGASFNENVAFTGTSGVLQLARSRSYSGTISGFVAGDSLDLTDIGFSKTKTTATFVDNGSHTGGVLTVTDGTHAAHITLAGDFTSSTFTASGDGHGGTKVIDPHVGAAAKPKDVLPLISAMAGMNDVVGYWVPTSDPGRSRPSVLAAMVKPRD
jgi:hypothetical protein